jgi:hypothetical protein
MHLSIYERRSDLYKLLKKIRRHRNVLKFWSSEVQQAQTKRVSRPAVSLLERTSKETFLISNTFNPKH